jgi:hypothetical protein
MRLSGRVRRRLRRKRRVVRDAVQSAFAAKLSAGLMFACAMIDFGILASVDSDDALSRGTWRMMVVCGVLQLTLAIVCWVSAMYNFTVDNHDGLLVICVGIYAVIMYCMGMTTGVITGSVDETVQLVVYAMQVVCGAIFWCGLMYAFFHFSKLCQPCCKLRHSYPSSFSVNDAV